MNEFFGKKPSQNCVTCILHHAIGQKSNYLCEYKISILSVISNQSLSVFEAAPPPRPFPLVLFYLFRTLACFTRFVSLINNELTSCI